MAGRQRQRYLIIALAIIFIAGLFVATAYLFSQGTLFTQPTDGYVPINISGDTCTSKTDCQQLIVDQYEVMDDTEFEEKWHAIQTDCSTTPYCRYKIPEDSVQLQEVEQ